MNKYEILLNAEKNMVSSDDLPANEIDIVLQVWQDLGKLPTLQQEDNLIKNILEQILEKEYDGNIPIPEYYTENEQQE